MAQFLKHVVIVLDSHVTKQTFEKILILLLEIRMGVPQLIVGFPRRGTRN